MIIPILFIILELGHILIRIRSIRHTWMLKVMKHGVGNIRVKRDWSEVWITICIGMIVIVIRNTKCQKTKTNKQIDKQK